MRRRPVLRLLFLLLLAAAGGAAYLAHQVTQPYRGWEKPVFVDLAPGTSTRTIAAQLKSAGVLRQDWPFLMLYYIRRSQTLKAGEYYFDQPLTVLEVLRKLRRGEVYQHSVTIREGYNIFEVADALAASAPLSGKVPREQVLETLRNPSLVTDLDPQATNLEGYLFPDTYYFTRRATPQEMAAAMVAHFRKVYRELEARHRSERSLREIVILASLVEKETDVPEERPLVAGVYHNRLKANLALQCDPTVVYAALLDGRYRGTIYQSDLTHDSPYNTYVRRGLPPGPIASPGRASLEAAMAPAATDYMYFVSTAERGHRFSKTGEEHARAVAEYRRKTDPQAAKRNRR